MAKSLFLCKEQPLPLKISSPRLNAVTYNSANPKSPKAQRICCSIFFLILSFFIMAKTKASAQQAAIDWEIVAARQGFFEPLQDEGLWVDKQALITSLEHSLNYLKTEKASDDYSRLAYLGVNKEIIQESLLSFKNILESSPDYSSFSKSVEQNFDLIKLKASGVSRSVKFTGYFQPTYQASRTKSATYKYPIYKAPTDFDTWPLPHPKRIFLEGYEGQGNIVSPLHGYELAYLKTRWEAFMIHVQGSAILNLDSGERMAVGFSAATKYPFRGVSKTFLKEHKVSWNKLSEFFEIKPDLLNQVLVKNDRYILFQENPHSEPIGSLGVPVIAERSIATDKSIMPPGALSVVITKLPQLSESGEIKTKESIRFVLDQDTGSAIKGTNRVDIFMGSGSDGLKKANAVYAQGELYYLLKKKAIL